MVWSAVASATIDSSQNERRGAQPPRIPALSAIVPPERLTWDPLRCATTYLHLILPTANMHTYTVLT